MEKYDELKELVKPMEVGILLNDTTKPKSIMLICGSEAYKFLTGKTENYQYEAGKANKVGRAKVELMAKVERGALGILEVKVIEELSEAQGFKEGDKVKIIIEKVENNETTKKEKE